MSLFWTLRQLPSIDMKSLRKVETVARRARVRAMQAKVDAQGAVDKMHTLEGAARRAETAAHSARCRCVARQEVARKRRHTRVNELSAGILAPNLANVLPNIATRLPGISRAAFGLTCAAFAAAVRDQRHNCAGNNSRHIFMGPAQVASGEDSSITVLHYRSVDRGHHERSHRHYENSGKRRGVRAMGPSAGVL